MTLISFRKIGEKLGFFFSNFSNYFQTWGYQKWQLTSLVARFFSPLYLFYQLALFSGFVSRFTNCLLRRVCNFPFKKNNKSFSAYFVSISPPKNFFGKQKEDYPKVNNKTSSFVGLAFERRYIYIFRSNKKKLVKNFLLVYRCFSWVFEGRKKRRKTESESNCIFLMVKC